MGVDLNTLWTWLKPKSIEINEMTNSIKKLIIKITKVIVRMIVISLELEADEPFFSLKKKVIMRVVMHI